MTVAIFDALSSKGFVKIDDSDPNIQFYNKTTSLQLIVGTCAITLEFLLNLKSLKILSNVIYSASMLDFTVSLGFK